MLGGFCLEHVRKMEFSDMENFLMRCQKKFKHICMTSGSTRMSIYNPLSFSDFIDFNWNACLLCVVKIGPLFCFSFFIFFMCTQIRKCWEIISWSYTIVVKRDLLMRDCSYGCISKAMGEKHCKGRNRYCS